MAQNTNVFRSEGDFITQVFREIQAKSTKMLSKEFSRTESRILGALSGLDGFIPSPLIQGHSGTAPNTPRDELGISQGTNEDDSQSDHHPEASVSQSQSTRNSGPDDGYDSSFRRKRFWLFFLRFHKLKWKLQLKHRAKNMLQNSKTT